MNQLVVDAADRIEAARAKEQVIATWFKQLNIKPNTYYVHSGTTIAWIEKYNEIGVRIDFSPANYFYLKWKDVLPMIEGWWESPLIKEEAP